VSDSLTPEAVASHLHGRLGTPYLYEPECESTQLLLLGSGLPEGATATTDHQTSGKGRHGRRWTAPAGSSVLVSVLLHPPSDRNVPELSLVAASATAQTVDDATGLTSQIKWPNDVMLNRRKVAGILCELSDGAVVVGIGLNVNQSRDELPHDAKVEPASLRTLTGATYDRAPLLGTLLANLEGAYDRWLAGGLDALYADIGARDFLRGRQVTVDGEDATAVMIARDGRLEVTSGNGHGATRTVESGEVLFER
jgi:BirA family biotin operon repressor/biotin-[acetyl-CoA-carboxylase] ligase